MNFIVKNIVKVVMLLVAFIIFVGSICSLDAEKISVGYCLMQCAVGEAVIFVALRNL